MRNKLVLIECDIECKWKLWVEKALQLFLMQVERNKKRMEFDLVGYMEYS